MKLFFNILLLVFLASTSYAQDKKALNKIEAAKIALITERLELTPEQAEKFWPIYREYNNQLRDIRKEFDQKRKNFDPNQASEEENRQMLELATGVKEQQLNLEKEYSDRILTVISTRQLNNLRNAERDFKEMLLQRIQARKQRQQRSRNNQRLENRRN